MIFWSVFFAIISAVLVLRAGIVMWHRLSDKTIPEIILDVMRVTLAAVVVGTVLIVAALSFAHNH